jgi:hypothetical protein
MEKISIPNLTTVDGKHFAKPMGAYWKKLIIRTGMCKI